MKLVTLTVEVPVALAEWLERAAHDIGGRPADVIAELAEGAREREDVADAEGDEDDLADSAPGGYYH